MANSDGKQAYKWRKKCGGWQVGYRAEALHPQAIELAGIQVMDDSAQWLSLMHIPATHSHEWVRECDLTRYPESKIEEPTK